MKRLNVSAKNTARRGFSLIEMLAASVVISMLLAALVGFSRTTARQVKRANNIRNQYPSTALLQEQITRDVRNADGFANINQGVALFGALSSNPRTGQGTHQLAQVTYQIENVRGLKVLVRNEQTRQGVTHKQIVWMDAGAISFSSIGVRIGDPPDARLSGSLTPMPPAIDAQFLDADGQTILSQRIRHHRELQ